MAKWWLKHICFLNLSIANCATDGALQCGWEDSSSHSPYSSITFKPLYNALLSARLPNDHQCQMSVFINPVNISLLTLHIPFRLVYCINRFLRRNLRHYQSLLLKQVIIQHMNLMRTIIHWIYILDYFFFLIYTLYRYLKYTWNKWHNKVHVKSRTKILLDEICKLQHELILPTTWKEKKHEGFHFINLFPKL